MHQEAHTGLPPKTTGMAARNALKHIASRVQATIGAEFFESLVKNLAEALEADCIYVGEFVGGKMERVRTVASWVNGKPGDAFESYTLAGSVAAQVAVGEHRVYTRDVLKKFPSDVLLLEMVAQACVAIPLLDPQRQAIGVLMAVYRRALANTRLPKSMLEMFAPRAAAELGRQQGEAALRESEQRYRMFVAQNPDAMWRIEFELPIPLELSEDEQIESIFDQGYLAECNDAAARRHGYDKAEQVIGSSVQEWAAREDPRLREQMRSAINSGYGFNTVQIEVPGPDGTQRLLLRSHWGIIENGTLTRIWGTTRDITELLREYGALTATGAKEDRTDP